MNQISAFEYVSILISIILGLGITQLLNALSDLLYNPTKVKFYWPHSLWICFILFLFIQDWFVTYQLKDKAVWYLPELLFVLLYPILLFAIAKMLLPTHDGEEKEDMKKFYLHQYPVIFFILACSAFISIFFNVFLLQLGLLEQLPLFVLLIAMIYFSWFKVKTETLHQIIAVTLILGSIISIIVARDIWIIK